MRKPFNRQPASETELILLTRSIEILPHESEGRTENCIKQTTHRTIPAIVGKNCGVNDIGDQLALSPTRKVVSIQC